MKNPRYEDTHDSESGHAEAVRVTFDPSVLTYEDLLEQWFFRLHDPTTLNRQGNDLGTQYRSAIFPQTPEQRETAERVIARVQASGRWKRPITTTTEPASTWYSAEAYHQDYLRKNPGGYTSLPARLTASRNRWDSMRRPSHLRTAGNGEHNGGVLPVRWLDPAVTRT